MDRHRAGVGVECGGVSGCMRRYCDVSASHRVRQWATQVAQWPTPTSRSTTSTVHGSCVPWEWVQPAVCVQRGSCENRWSIDGQELQVAVMLHMAVTVYQPATPTIEVAVLICVQLRPVQETQHGFRTCWHSCGGGLA
jgi:hypothetical protein